MHTVSNNTRPPSRGRGEKKGRGKGLGKGLTCWTFKGRVKKRIAWIKQYGKTRFRPGISLAEASVLCSAFRKILPMFIGYEFVIKVSSQKLQYRICVPSLKDVPLQVVSKGGAKNGQIVKNVEERTINHYNQEMR